ncbi:Theileria-specific sub-telomeric protein, SVSP family, putative [Theileria annulata]|uniref:Theileria-specific sub-telomeric protein, SVSP family, putative n=1 Tax=Theileria annulata TaxID=5874 RepID=Q4UD78_THEAN|nr:Theileria-specific sub-telomeric protein, SVSP family, putative [Theileria annulata]CAI74961.1 Theileria-specific sub-telomeric protein, SVSP family, putative [Theileria annulata]|eukprot:XP_952693.1 Theileria-specific sub-telomeric protein, SVSP family, putative [Theileria annulata]
MTIEIMNVCVWYRYIIIFILIGSVKCGDQDPDEISGPDDGDDDNFDLITNEMESLVTEEDETNDEPNDNITSSEEIQDITQQLYNPNDQQTEYLQGEQQSHVYDSVYYDSYKPIEYFYQPSLQYNQPPYQYYTYYDQSYGGYRYHQYHYGLDSSTNYYQLSRWNYKYNTEYSNYEQSYSGPQTSETSEPTQETTQEPTKTIKPKYSYKYNRPTRRHQHQDEPPSQYEQPIHILKRQEPTQLTTEPAELEPETIPVEIGSDDEEPQEEPSGPGDGDQPPKGPEEGAEGDDEEEEDEDVKRCNTITLLKMNEEGELVEMIMKEDYKITWIDHNITKYKLYVEVELILCDDEVLFSHYYGKNYPLSMLHNRTTNTFVLDLYNVFMLVKNYKGKWIKRTRHVLNYVKLYTKDYYGNDVLITKKHFYLDLTEKCSFKYSLKTGARCCKVMVRDLLAWEKDPEEEFPLSISITRLMNVMVKFKNYIVVYGKRGGKYKLVYSKYI